MKEIFVVCFLLYNFVHSNIQIPLSPYPLPTQKIAVTIKAIQYLYRIYLILILSLMKTPMIAIIRSYALL